MIAQLTRTICRFVKSHPLRLVATAALCALAAHWGAAGVFPLALAILLWTA